MSEERDQFERFLVEMEDALERLVEDVEAAGEAFGPLDYSVESVDRLERWYDAWLDGRVTSAAGEDVVRTRLARYLGQVVRKQAGGKWDLCTEPRAVDYGLPILVGLRGMPDDYWWCPLVLVGNYRVRRPKGLFRRAVERHVEKARAAGTARPEWPRYAIVGRRPVKAVRTPDGGLDVLAYDWETGELVRNLGYLDRVMAPGDAEVDFVDEAAFEAAVAELRAERG